jgi:hypothetical protein
MSQERPKNLAASVHQRIINLARAQNSDANLIFTRYGLERFLYRLSRSCPYATDSIFVVNPNGVLTPSICFKRFQSIARRYAKII